MGAGNAVVGSWVFLFLFGLGSCILCIFFVLAMRRRKKKKKRDSLTDLSERSSDVVPEESSEPKPSPSKMVDSPLARASRSLFAAIDEMGSRVNSSISSARSSGRTSGADAAAADRSGKLDITNISTLHSHAGMDLDEISGVSAATNKPQNKSDEGLLSDDDDDGDSLAAMAQVEGATIARLLDQQRKRLSRAAEIAKAALPPGSPPDISGDDALKRRDSAAALVGPFGAEEAAELRAARSSAAAFWKKTLYSLPDLGEPTSPPSRPGAVFIGPADDPYTTPQPQRSVPNETGEAALFVAQDISMSATFVDEDRLSERPSGEAALVLVDDERQSERESEHLEVEVEGPSGRISEIDVDVEIEAFVDMSSPADEVLQERSENETPTLRL